MRSLLLVLMSIGLSVATATAAPRPPAELITLRKDLADAVKAKDARRAVTYASFPFSKFVYGDTYKLTQADFIKDFPDMFYGKAAKCIGTASLESDGQGGWTVDCHDDTYDFGLVKGHWRYTSYEQVVD